jgi:hypothetical protein
MQEDYQPSEAMQLALADEADIRQYKKERTERFEVHYKNLWDYKMAFRQAARNFLHQRRCMGYWARDSYGGMDRFKEARKLDFLQMCLSKARGELRWAIEQVKKMKGECDGN